MEVCEKDSTEKQVCLHMHVTDVQSPEAGAQASKVPSSVIRASPPPIRSTT